ncbi:sensor histidine kinase [Emergencia sp.]|uniref:sensor histidine kinase n=1 Tax=Emergencia sp. TaxID=1926557 RepID=UPI003AEFA041
MLGKYIKSKNKYILLFLLYLGIFCLIAYLYDMPIDACLYAMLLCIFFAIIFMTYSYFRYKQKAEYLMDIRGRIEYGPEQMPKAANGIEEQYQEIIQQLYKKTAEAISKNDRNMTDMIDYYTLWAHQIKTPIAAMRLLLQSESGGRSKDELAMELFKIEQYVEMVLQYLRLGSDSTDFVIRKQPLDDIVREAVKKYSTTFIKKKISLEYRQTDAVVISDEKWLSFVIEQLLSNALKYTYVGKISIYMDEDLPNTLIIEDTGIGIQSEDLPRVFDKGYTGYNGRKDKKSTGIGLYLCRQVMNKLGHTMSIESEVGKGTKVKLGLDYCEMSVYE